MGVLARISVDANFASSGLPMASSRPPSWCSSVIRSGLEGIIGNAHDMHQSITSKTLEVVKSRVEHEVRVVLVISTQSAVAGPLVVNDGQTTPRRIH